MRMRFNRLLGSMVCAALLVCAANAAVDDDDKAPAAGPQAKLPDLTERQARAVGVVIGRPQAMKTTERMRALGLVLDPTQLLEEFGRMEAADVAAQASSAELSRLRQLFSAGGSASQRAIEAARIEQVKSRFEARSAAARVDLHWSPILALPPHARATLLDASVRGRTLLVRAELPGLHSLGTLPSKAFLEVDGTRVPGRILGVLRQASDAQGVALLVEVSQAPTGLGPGARIPVDLMTPPQAGFLLPRDAVFYDQNGAYVYKRLAGRTNAERWRFAAVKVSLLQAVGEGWLVQGIDDDDDVVVEGAGVLWSMQDAGSASADDDD